MDDLFNNEKFPGDEEIPPPEEPRAYHRTGPTGPRSPEGKATSSLNRITHGCRSEKTVLRHEDPAEFEFTMNFWFERYQPADGIASLLVEETARAHWFLKRNQKRLEDVEYHLPGDAWCWTETHQKLFQNATRYKTTAERAFFRFFKELEAHYDRLDRIEDLQTRAREAGAKLQIKWLNEKEKLTAEKLKIEQIVVVETVDGKCQTCYFPTNEVLIRKVADRPEPPLYLLRYISFPRGVPEEYAWTRPNVRQIFTETVALQKMTYEFWLELIKHEKANGEGHICDIPMA